MSSLADKINAAKAVRTATAGVAGAVAGAGETPAAGTTSLSSILNKAKPAPVAGAGPALGGGERLSGVRDALRVATIGGGRNDLPLGTGAFLLKSGKFLVTDDGKWKISVFSFLCLQGIKDGNGIVHGVEGYSGPLPGDSYDVSMFQDFSPKYQKGTISKNLAALAACMGWTKEQVKLQQSTEAGLDIVFELLKGMMCVSMEDGSITGVESIFSNQAIVQLTRSTSIVEKKDPVTKQPLYVDDKGTKATTTYFNEYWDKKIPVATMLETIGEEAMVVAFGSEVAVQAAHANEVALAATF